MRIEGVEHLEAALKSSGLPVVIARIGAVYGPSFSFSMADRMQAGRAFLPGRGGRLGQPACDRPC